MSTILRRKLAVADIKGAELARVLGVDASAVSHKLAGRRPWTLAEAFAVVELLRDAGQRVSIETIFGSKSRRAA